MHDVEVDGLWMDATEVTNAQLARFVQATGHRTMAEWVPSADDDPGVPPDLLVRGSILFAPPPAPVPLDNALHWCRLAFDRSCGRYRPGGRGTGTPDSAADHVGCRTVKSLMTGAGRHRPAARAACAAMVAAAALAGASSVASPQRPVVRPPAALAQAQLRPALSRPAQPPPTSPSPAAVPAAALRDEVWRAETAFAQTMAERDLSTFRTFLSSEAVFWGAGPARGPEAIVAAWRGYFEGAVAPFAWRPETVEVLASGTLAFSSGPVFDPSGRRVGTFNSVWQRQPDGRWLVVFDKGCPPPPQR